MTKDNGSFARARHRSLPLGESLQIATSPSAPRNEEKKAPGNDNSLRDFAISITSFRVYWVMSFCGVNSCSATLQGRAYSHEAQASHYVFVPVMWVS